MKRFFMCIVAFALSLSAAFGQARTVQGVVTSGEDSLPLPQLTVLLKGTTQGVVTNMDGVYSISVPGPSAVLIFKYTGYETQEVEVGQQYTIDVVMKPAMEAIDQVVVMGYGTAKKVSSAVGKFSTVKGADIASVPVADVNVALAGKVPGLTVMGESSRPGKSQTIMLHGSGSMRGSSTPLYVLDGQPISSRDVRFLNPQDFANVTVLTDASATSIYGSRAANGVIYITSKRGKSGDGRVEVRASYGISQLSSTEMFDRMMTTPELLSFLQEVGKLTENEMKQYLDSSRGQTFRWYKYLYQNNAPVHQATVSFNKVFDNTRVYLSGGYYSELGMESFVKFDRYNFRANVSSDFKSWLTAGGNVSLSYANSVDYTDRSLGLSSDKALLLPPYFSPYDENGREKDSIINKQLSNRYTRKALEKYISQGSKDFVGIASAFLEFHPLQGLTLRSQGNMEFQYNHARTSVLPTAPWRKKLGHGTLSEAALDSEVLSMTNTVEYRFTLGDLHTFIPLIGQEYRASFSHSQSVYTEGLENPDLMLLQFGKFNPNPNLYSSYGESWTSSYFGRLEYNYDERYYADATVRRDATSRLAPKHRSGIFWSVGFMWQAKREEFLRNVKWLDALALRASVGTSGNASIGEFSYFSGIAKSDEAWRQKLGYQLERTPANPGLQWEKQTKLTVGVQMGFLNRIQADISYYYRYSYDMIMPGRLDYSTGFTTYDANLAAKTNMGVDLRLDVTAYSNGRGDFVAPYITFNYNREYMNRLYGDEKMYTQSGYTTAYIVGQPINFYYPRFYRVNPENGKPEWYNPSSEDRTVAHTDPEDVTSVFSYDALAQPINRPFLPPINGGFGLNLNFYGAYLVADFTYSLNKWLLNAIDKNVSNPMRDGHLGNYTKELIGNYWKEPGQNAKYPGIAVLDWVDSDDRILSDASYLRLSHLTVGYSVPKEWLNKTRFFNSAKVFCSMRNLFTITKFRGADPAVYAANGESAVYTPATRQITFGVQFDF